MKTIKSVLGDTWIITNKQASPEGGDRTFGLNEDMQEMIDKSQQSEKWAKRLRLIAGAPLNDDKDCIYVPDKNYFNWYRTISLESPEFIPDDYSSGAQLVYPEDTRLHISESVGEPGAHYGPYYIYGRDDEGRYGVVGFSEELSEVPGILEKLKGTEFDHLPVFSRIAGTVYDLDGGYQADTLAVSNHSMDIWTTDLHTTIVDAEGKIVFNGQLSPEEIITYRQSADALRAMLESNSEHLASFIPRENERLEKFSSTPTYIPVDEDDLRNKLTSLPEHVGVKLVGTSRSVEFVVSSEIIKSWANPEGKLIEIPESPTKDFFKELNVEYLQLTGFRHYTILFKDVGGFLVDINWSNALPIDKLFGFVRVNTKEEDVLYDLQEKRGDHDNKTPCGNQEMMEILSNSMRCDQPIVNKQIPIEALIKRAKPTPSDANESSGPGM
jgi:hypothetical protein